MVDRTRVATVVAGIAAGLGLSGAIARLRSSAHRRDAAAPSTVDRDDAERAEMVQRMHAAVEDERHRIAVDLHNRPIQELAGVGYQLERAAMALDRGDTDTTAELIEQATTDLFGQLEAIRLIMSELRPPVLAERGLTGALETLKARLVADRPELRVVIDGADLGAGVGIETALYRIAQEALSNVADHADANEVHVKLTSATRRVDMTIADDGCGFDTSAIPAFVAERRYGIAAMRDRAAMFDGTVGIESGTGGTTVRCSIPRTVLAEADEATS